MMNRNSLKLLRPLLIVFVLQNAFFLSGKTLLAKWNMDQQVLIIGNLLIFLMVLISFLLLHKGIFSSNPQSFIRAMYGSFILKFFVLAIAAFIYIQVAGKNVNKSALFTCMGFYFVYTFIEVNALMKLLKRKKNA